MPATPTSRRNQYQPPLPLPGSAAQRAGTARPSSPPTGPGWKLDEKTRRVGRRGVALARAALAGSTADRQANAA